MSSEKIKELINEYFDNELDKSEEVFLFTNLSQNKEAREYFKQMNVLSENVKNTFEEFPLGLEEDILSATVSRSERSKKFSFKIPTIISYAFSVVLLILSIVLYSNSVEYKKDIEINMQQINYQNKMLEMMFNSLPPAEVKTKLDNEIIIRPTM
ncbi:hypothetical protein MNBD_IGNAVI01-1060 [hydrothermal vent metagenome]|uniref:Uncharacterized protein n=1 Tax=hydrothermal vent metagenome TaxID=652676 RepID=A0A3B1D160_9ZZZZ